MAFKDYSTTPASNTNLADGTYIGPNMFRNKVRPALQQLAADGKALADDVATFPNNPALVGQLKTDLAATSTAKGTDLLGVRDTVAPAYLKTVSDIISGLPVSITRFLSASKIASIRARTNADDLSANFADALASGVKELQLGWGLYNVSSAIVMATAEQRLIGAGARRCEIRINSTSASAITLANGIPGYELRGFKISRAGAPVVGAVGVHFLGTTDESILEDLHIEGHYDNLKLGTCDNGWVRRLKLTKAVRYGCYQTCASTYGPSQWDVDDVLMNQNGSDGWLIQPTVGPAGMIVGQMRNIRGFANSGRDLHILGTPQTPVFDLRLSDAFFGSSGYGGVRIDSYGGKHRISGFFERSGREPTGPTLSTPATAQGVGLEITANNIDVNVYGSTIDDNALDGILHSGGLLNVSTSNIYNNGQALTAGRRNAINSGGGELLVTSTVAINTPVQVGGAQNTSQLYAVATSHDNVCINGNWLQDNTNAAITLGATANAVVGGNAAEGSFVYRMPGTFDVLRFNSAFDPAATGGNKGVGTLNVGSGLFKNGTAYVNP